MIIVNTHEVAGKTIRETIGIVRGNAVRAKWVGADIVAGFKNIIGGRLSQYEELMTEAREAAIAEMKADAEKLGADGIVNVHFSTSQIAQGAAEILVYGTAVKFKK
mgnify:CR=1 FL=1